jgi:predicted DCC family thiol-disulfide oxidoreductase YuxK
LISPLRELLENAPLYQSFQTQLSIRIDVMKLTFFFDSYCPLCVAEVAELSRFDTKRLLVFEDIHASDFETRYPDINRQAANRLLHARLEDRRMIYGLDATYQSWRYVEQKRWIAVLRWPLVRSIADFAYYLFARNRHLISFLLTGKSRCGPCRVSRDPGCEL